MLSVPLPEDELLPLLPRELSIGVDQRRRRCAWPRARWRPSRRCERALAAHEIDAARVRINVAAHSPMLEPILAEFGAFLRGVRDARADDPLRLQPDRHAGSPQPRPPTRRTGCATCATPCASPTACRSCWPIRRACCSRSVRGARCPAWHAATRRARRRSRSSPRCAIPTTTSTTRPSCSAPSAACGPAGSTSTGRACATAKPASASSCPPTSSTTNATGSSRDAPVCWRPRTVRCTSARTWRNGSTSRCGSAALRRRHRRPMPAACRGARWCCPMARPWPAAWRNACATRATRSSSPRPASRGVRSMRATTSSTHATPTIWNVCSRPSWR